MTRAFWKGKRVLLTGHTGFKGSWLALWLASLGAEVGGFALAPETSPSLYDVARVGEGLVSWIGDLRDFSAVEAAVRSSEPEVVFHLGAQSLVRRGYRDPVATYATNVLGTVHLLDAVRRVGTARAVLVVTSDKCYENREWVWPYREDDPMGGHDPYSNSKGCAELVVSAFRRSYFAGLGIGLASARAGNVIGGGDWSENRLLADIVRSLAAGQPVVIRNPQAVRPWQHVLDALSGYLLLAERLWNEPTKWSGGYNFGPGSEDARTVGDIVDTISARLGGTWIRDPNPGPHEAKILKLDSSKSRAVLGWRPRLDLDTALTWIADWHRAHAAGADMRVVTTAQIERYRSIGEVR